MSGWNALAALAAGGEAYLAHKETTRKEKLQAQLEKDRIAGEVQREKDKEDRAEARRLKKVDHSALVEESPGNWVAQDYNEDKQPIGSKRVADSAEIMTWKDGLNKSKTAGLELDLATKKLAEYDANSALDRRVKESQIRANDRRNVAEEQEVAPPTYGDVVSDLWKNSEDLIKQYTGTPEAPGPLKTDQARELAEKVVKFTFNKPRGERGDLREAYRKALQQMSTDPRVLPKKKTK